LTQSCAGLLKPKGSKLKQLKSTFNADNNMQVVLVYFQPFRRNSLLKCALQLKIAKKFNKTSF